MSEETKKSGGEVQFPLNVRLLEESTKIKEERKVIKERIKKIEASRDQVSESVFQKVRSDYTNQLDSNTNQLLEKKQDIDRELSTLYEAKRKVEENVNTHKEKLEEINFRNNLGEYKKGEFHKLADEQNEKLGKFEKILAAIESNIKQYESLFEGEDDLFEGPEKMEAAPPPPPPSHKPRTEAPINVDEDYQIGGGEGYFGPDTGEVSVESVSGKESTDKAIDVIAKEEGKPAKITIIEGEGDGKTFELTEEELTIGRASSNTIVLKEAKVSRQHACVKKTGKEYLIEDLHSSNGIYINDEKVNEHALSDGDIIRIGDFVLKFTS